MSTRIPVTTSFVNGRTLRSILLPHINKANTFPQLLSRVNDIIDHLNLATDPTIQDLIIDVNDLADAVANSGGGGGGGGGNAYGTFATAGSANLVAATTNAVITFVAGTGMVLTANVGSDGAMHFSVNGAVLTVNNTTHAFGKLEGDLNVNGAAFATAAALANNSTYLGGQLPSYYANVVNLTGVILPANLPYASPTTDGIVSNTVQSMRGVKTWGDATIFNALVTANAALTVNGLSTLTDANVTATLTVAGLGVFGLGIFNGLLTANAALTVNGVSLLTGNVTASGAFANVTGTLNVSGITTLKANVLVSGAQLNVATGNIHVGGNLVLDGLSTLTGNASFGGFANVATTLQVAGLSLFNAAAFINAAATVNGTFTFKKDISANGDLGAATQVLASAGPGGNAYWVSLSGGGLLPDANSTHSGVINISSQTLAGDKTWLGTSQFTEYLSNTVNKGNSTATLTLNWTDGNDQTANLNANCTLTLTNPQPGGRYSIRLYSGSGGWSVTWPASVLWPDNRTPVQSQFGSKTDLYVLEYDALLSKYLGSYNQNYG